MRADVTGSDAVMAISVWKAFVFARSLLISDIGLVDPTDQDDRAPLYDRRR